MKKDLISVIVPIYNVEQYLDKCVESIVNQTYKNLEVILVDDGSTDDSGQKCDNWAEKDTRVKVIHKANGGLSDARNVGIKEASGNLIGFVDGDDYIEKQMYERLQQNLTKYKADISICNVQYVDEQGNYLPSYFKGEKEPLRVLEQKTALYLLIEDASIQSFAWNKLYRASLFKEVQYPKGKVLEDRATTYKLFDKAGKVVDDRTVGYNYVQRKDSIMHTYSHMAIKDELEAIHERQEYLEKYEELEEILMLNYLYSVVNIFRSYYGENRRDETLDEILAKEWMVYRMHYPKYQKALGQMIRKIMRKGKSIRIQAEQKLFYGNKRMFRWYSLLFFHMKKWRDFVRRKKNG